MVLQWTKSHANTIGNEIADEQAREGLEKVLQNQNEDNNGYHDWKYWNVKASINRCKDFFISREQNNFLISISTSEWGVVYKQILESKTNSSYAHQWTKQNKKLLPYLSRDTIRIWIAIKSGKIAFNEYLCRRLRKLMLASCTFCGKRPENIMHFLGQNSCDDFAMRMIKHELRSRGMDLINCEYNQEKSKWKQNKWNIDDIDPDNVLTYIFPDRRLTLSTRIKMIQAIVNTTRKIFQQRRRRNWDNFLQEYN